MYINESHLPLTVSSLAGELTRLGITEGMTVLVHTSLKSIGRWIAGGPVAVILALEQAVGHSGTIAMPAHSSDLSDPALWENPPVPMHWWETIRKEMPVFDRELTPTWRMGAVAECFRKQKGTLRSYHPQVSFAARGTHAAFITEGHALESSLGEQSPLARLYDCGASVLLFGVNHDKNTSLHLAEYRALYPGKRTAAFGAPCIVGGKREWVTFEDLDYDADDFIAIGQDFERDCGAVRTGLVGDALIRLMPMHELVDYGVRWMEKNRNMQETVRP